MAIKSRSKPECPTGFLWLLKLGSSTYSCGSGQDTFKHMGMPSQLTHLLLVENGPPTRPMGASASGSRLAGSALYPRTACPPSTALMKEGRAHSGAVGEGKAIARRVLLGGGTGWQGRWVSTGKCQKISGQPLLCWGRWVP